METFQYLCTKGGFLSEIQECVAKTRRIAPDEALVFACQTERLDVIQMLVKTFGASFNIGCLIEASLVGNLDIVKFIVDHKKFNINDTRSGTSAMFAAIAGKNLHIVKFLVEACAKISYECLRKSIESSLDILQYCMTNMGEYFTTVTLGRMLSIACEAGRLENVEYLISRGADIHIDIDYPLQIAAQVGHLHVVEYLVRAGANIGAYNDLAVRQACWEKKYEVVKYLVSVGADRTVITPEAERYIQICERTRNRAQKKIYFWWIPICYDPKRDSGKRMMASSWEETRVLLETQ
jgi:hypothetical protein